MASGAERQRRYRQRLRNGLVRVEFWTDEANLTAVLSKIGKLPAALADNPRAISNATKSMVEETVAVDIHIGRNA